MQNAIVVTTINPPTKQLEVVAALEGWRLIIVGDHKTPAGWQLDGAEYISLAAQEVDDFADTLPLNSYSRKMIGYLEALRGGAEWILDTDDDTEPTDAFGRASGLLERLMRGASHPSGFVNSFSLFRSFVEPVWPRGYPLEHILDSAPSQSLANLVFCPVRQYMIDGDSDVDAIQRLTRRPYAHEFGGQRSFAVASDCYCPFNSQATLWHRSAAPLMYLPTTCSMRATDIIRGYVAQRCMREQGWRLALEPAAFKQERNAHDLMDDFQQEMWVYLNVEKMVQLLEGLTLGGDLPAMMAECYGLLYRTLMDSESRPLHAWNTQIKEIENV